MANAKTKTNEGADEVSSFADDLQHVTGSEADAARIAAGQPIDDATEATEEEVPAENIAHISDASLPSREEMAAAADRAAKAAARRK